MGWPGVIVDPIEETTHLFSMGAPMTSLLADMDTALV